tara:strand:- start:30 stop:686 length:657 start_codon:yes stop_codon:yes gene_type:complete
MKLITEINEDINFLVEKTEAGEKSHYITGIFMQSEQKNRNGRLYPKQVLANEVNRYNEDFVKKGRAFGELGHPDGPQINLERVSHMIKELKEDGPNFVGKAKIMDTPYGKIVKNLIDEGAKLGVSSRGMGSLKPHDKDGQMQVVQDDYHLATAADIVADPSAPDAFVQGIMEGKEWVWNNGVLREQQIESYHKEVQDASQSDLEEVKLKVFANFISKL